MHAVPSSSLSEHLTRPSQCLLEGNFYFTEIKLQYRTIVVFVLEKVVNNVHFKGSLGFIDTVCGSRASASLLGQLRLFAKRKPHIRAETRRTYV